MYKYTVYCRFRGRLDSAFSAESKLRFSFFFFFFPFFLTSRVPGTISTIAHCSSTVAAFFITVHALKNIKNGSHDTIHTFKNYFATVLSVFSFQFSVSVTLSSIQTAPIWMVGSPPLLTIINCICFCFCFCFFFFFLSQKKKNCICFLVSSSILFASCSTIHISNFFYENKGD